MDRRRARLRRRRVRPVALAVVLALLLLVLVGGGRRLGPLVGRGGGTATGASGISITGFVDLFDDRVHEVDVAFDPAEFRAMVATYAGTRAHPYIEATVTIDGTRLDRVGLRLKGNSTLEQAVFLPDPTGEVPTEVRPGIGDRPEALPLLLRFDWFVDGQRYQDVDELALRLPFPGQPAGLNEAVALDAVGAAGLPTQRHAYADVSVNGSAPHLRLLVEVPTAEWTQREVGTGGTLFRATGYAGFEDLGDDPAAYAADFEQITGRNHVDLGPLVDLVTWANRADDATFAAELDERLDTDDFARYLAVHALVLDPDDVGGGGRNYYLWFHDRTGRARILTWDVNLALYRAVERERVRVEVAEGPPPTGVVGEDGVLTFELDPRQVGPPPSNNVLKNRFVGLPDRRAAVHRHFDELCDALVRSGALRSDLRRTVATLSGSAAVDRAALAAEVELMEEALDLAAANCDDPLERGYLAA